MKINEKELIVRALQNGTVIDHIPADKLFKIVKLLCLDKITTQVTIGNNLESKKLGKKAVIKISDKFFAPDELNRLALIIPSAVINVIKDYQVVEKMALTIPDEVTDILQCVNPMCITNKENISTKFHIVDKVNGVVQCHYCERFIKQKDLILK